MGLFQRKSKFDRLKDKYHKKLEEAYKMSTISRSKSDQLRLEADVILRQLISLEKQRA